MATIVLPISFTFVTAQSSPIQAQSNAFLTVSPNPIGVGQQASVVMWLAEIPPFDRTGVSVDFEGFKVTVTSPDGTNQTLGPFKSDDIGAAYTKYTPITTGTYSFQFIFPGQIINASSTISGASSTTVLVNYPPAISKSVSLTVQDEPIPLYPETDLPLPSEYWSGPVQGANDRWSSISGNWLSVPLQFGFGCDADLGASNPYTIAPNTAHIAWTKPLAIAGLVGGAIQ